MNRKVLQRMIWKDARTAGSLAIATPCLIVGFYFLLMLFGGMGNVNSQGIMSLAYAIWFLLPMLIAWGAPALLVGGEEESGSLAWLQTLPAGWRSIAGSKLLVTTACLLLSWIVATTCFMIYWSLLSDYQINRIRQYGGLPDPFWVHLVGAVTLSLAVMLSSFTTAYWFRSPITALVALVPLLTAVVWGAMYTTVVVIPASQLHRSPEAVAQNSFAKLAAIVAAWLMILLLASLFAAWRRLTWPESQRPIRPAVDELAADAFRPPRYIASSMVIASMAGRPKKTAALLWQQFRPIRWQFLLLTAAAIFGALLTGLPSRDVVMFGTLICSFALQMIAALTFYSDSVRKRCQFLYDRGISPTLVWATRVGPTLLATTVALAVAIVAGVVHDWVEIGGGSTIHWDVRLTVIVSTGFAAFALSQLVSQWSPRPTLTFFAGPVFVQMAAIVLAALLIFYTRASSVLLLSAAILLFASWKLMPKWMAGEKGKPYLVPFFGYIALALFLPYVVVLGVRWSTTPPEQTEWRGEMVSMQLPSRDGGVVQILDPAFAIRLDSYATSATVEQAGRADRIAKELADANSIGAHVSFKELLQIVGNISESSLVLRHDFQQRSRSAYGKIHVYPAAEGWEGWRNQQFDAVRVLLKWSRETRQQAVDGRADFNVLLGVAEMADLIAAKVLTAYVEQDGMTDQIRELVQSMPDAELIKQSRRNSLIRSWREFQSQTLGRRFGGEYSHVPTQWWLGIERTRADRYVDELCKYMLDQWNSDQNFKSPGAMEKLQFLESEAYLLDPDYGFGSDPWHGPELSERIAVTIEVDALTSQL